MSNPIKQIIFDHQLKKCHRRYEKIVEEMRDPYKQWIVQNEPKKKSGEKDEYISKIEKLDFSEFMNIIRKKKDAYECLPDGWFVICQGQGNYSMPVMEGRSVFSDYSGFGMAYADEDMVDPENGARYGAWFKPDYSPDTLMSFFYFGSIIFFRGVLVRRALISFQPAIPEEECSDRQYFYDFMLFFTEFLENDSMRIKHIPQVLFHSIGEGYQPEDPKKPEVVNENVYWGYEPMYDACKLAAIRRRGREAHMKEIVHAGRKYHVPVYHIEKDGRKPMVSIIIPSKNNADVLAVCLESLYERTDYSDYEVIVVDNGSNEGNRRKVGLLQEKYGFRYLYEPMEFNFSKMCNLGFAASKGAYIMLLNDDMEILQPDWLDVMVGQVLVDYVGAVGAKLLYPDSDLIQHAGITNLPVGPAHKLLKEHDNIRDYYYGRNVLPYDVIGVTGACLLVSRTCYLETEKFCEDIAVSYNDVDFCFSLRDLGYRNVVRNDVVLYHHESLSRGDDTMSDEKWDRLLHEKDIVYERHLHLKGKDSYYNPNLAGFKHKYFCSYLYPYERRNCYNQVKPFKGKIKEEWHNDCLTVTLEHVRLERKLDLQEEQDVYWLEGWAYVLNMDTSRYERSLVLIDESGSMYEASLHDRYRQDVEEILPEQTNVGLAGFSCRIRRDELHPGEYTVALLYRDKCSRQRLYKECKEKLIV